MSDAEKDARRVGRDEMNLAEFPISLLTDYSSKGVKTIAFEDKHGTLTVIGSDAYGLPTAIDSDIIVGLIQLTKQRNDFTDPKVRFTRYELLNLLGWPDKGQSYRRLDESLHRWVSVTLKFDGCWWDHKQRRRLSASFHILDYVILPDKNDPRIESSFGWNQIFFKSCHDGYIKKLDLETYFTLKSAVSKQLYRFLDKRFYNRPDWTFDLRELAHERVGLSRSYAPRNIKQKLQPALEELEGIGFLEEMTGADRYSKVGRGEWTIRLVRKLPATAKPEPEAEPTGLEAELVKRGVTRRMAAELVASHPEATIRAKVEVFDWLRNRRDHRIRRNGPGYLVKSIVDDYPAPDDFTAERDRTQRQATTQAQDDEARREKARARAEKARIDVYWAGLSPEEQAKLEADALASADAEVRAQCATGPLPVRRMTLAAVRETHIRRLLHLPAPD